MDENDPPAAFLLWIAIALVFIVLLCSCSAGGYPMYSQTYYQAATDCAPHGGLKSVRSTAFVVEGYQPYNALCNNGAVVTRSAAIQHP